MAALAKSKERPLVLENCFAAPFLARAPQATMGGPIINQLHNYFFKNSSRGCSQFFFFAHIKVDWVEGLCIIAPPKNAAPLKTMGKRWTQILIWKKGGPFWLGRFQLSVNINRVQDLRWGLTHLLWFFCSLWRRLADRRALREVKVKHYDKKGHLFSSLLWLLSVENSFFIRQQR